MSEHDLSEDEREINVLDTDSRLSSRSGSDRSPRSHCSSPDHAVRSSHASANAALPFSISNLLGKNFDQKTDADGAAAAAAAAAFYDHQPGILQQRNSLGFVPSGFYNQGVLRVPAHRPLGGASAGSPGAIFSPWTLSLDPVLQRSAAAAAFATQVVKDRLAGKRERERVVVMHTKT